MQLESNSNKITEVHVSELNLDPRNPRKRTHLSAGVIQKSLKQFGACRSIVIDEAGTVRAGNGTLQEASQLGIDKVIIVETTGNELVAVRRTGLTDDQWKQYAVADNTASDFSGWDENILAEISQEVDLTGFFPEDKLNEILGNDGIAEDQVTTNPWDSTLRKLDSEDKEPYQQKTFTLHDSQIDTVEDALRLAKSINKENAEENQNSNGNALFFISQYYLKNNE